MTLIAKNLARVREQIAHAAAKAGSVADGIALVAITKTHPAEKVREAIEAGQTLFGESRVQEARAKIRGQMEELLALPRLSIEGLMTIPPLAEKAEASRKYFVGLRELRDAYEKEFDLRLPQLSMGMTNDFPIAVEEGATLVRVGTAIFGERSKTQRE